MSNPDFLAMSPEDILKMSKKDFATLVRGEAFHNLEKLLPISEALNGDDIRNITLWFLSFVFAWAESTALPARTHVLAILKMAVSTLEVSNEECN